MENTNSVAFTAKIKTLAPIEGADKIELATIEGWTSIVQKGVHSVGDLVLCLTTDAVIPQPHVDAWNIGAYLRTRTKKGSHDMFNEPIKCVRTIKLKGVYSECILIDIRRMPWNKGISLTEGQDLMEKLGIFKYEPPAVQVVLPGGRRIIQKDNLNFNKYYKFPNIKNVPEMFKEGDDVIITRKIHGTNARYGIVKKMKLSFLDKIKKFFGNKWIEYEFVYGSHNVLKGSDTNGYYSTDVWKEVGDRYDIKNKLWAFIKERFTSETLGTGIILYGEIYGPGIQGDAYSYYLKRPGCVFFDVELNKQYCNRDEFDAILDGLDLYSVPVLYSGPLKQDIVDHYVRDQYTGHGSKVPHEGVVISTPSGDRSKIAKVINPDYLIYSEKYNVPDSH